MDWREMVVTVGSGGNGSCQVGGRKWLAAIVETVAALSDCPARASVLLAPAVSGGCLPDAATDG